MRLALIIIAWIVLFFIALSVDVPVSNWFHVHLDTHHFKSTPLAVVLKSPGTFYFTLALIPAILWRHGRRWHGPTLLILSAALSGLGYTIAKWCIGRHRPFIQPFKPFEIHPFINGIKGLFVAEKNLAFPSGHTCLAFATATAMTYLFPRQAILFFFLALLVGLERITENAHYPSDVVAGAILGILSAWLARALIDRFTRSRSRLEGEAPAEPTRNSP